MSFTVFDAHCDTMQKITDFGGNLKENEYHLDLNRIFGLGGGYVQVFAAFIDRKQDALPPFLRGRQIINRYFEEINKNNDLILDFQSRILRKNLTSDNKNYLYKLTRSIARTMEFFPIVPIA